MISETNAVPVFLELTFLGKREITERKRKKKSGSHNGTYAIKRNEKMRGNMDPIDIWA